MLRHFVSLGTLITEWKPGQEICKEFLKDEKMFQNTADQLVRMAQYYQFDGWLINIENQLSVRILCVTVYATDLSYKNNLSKSVAM